MSNLPTLTVMRCGEWVPGHGIRNFDPHLKDGGYEDVVLAAQTLMLDLAINENNSQNHRILVVSSPFVRCLESAVIVAQTMGVPAIQVHYGLTERVSSVRDMGWDWEVAPLYCSESEMRRIVAQQSRQGERRGLCRVTIEEYVGRKLSNDDINEAADMAYDRISSALEEVRNSILMPGDHAIVVGHIDTLPAVVERYGPRGVEVLSTQPSAFISVKTMSQNCFWLGGRSKIKISGET